MTETGRRAEYVIPMGLLLKLLNVKDDVTPLFVRTGSNQVDVILAVDGGSLPEPEESWRQPDIGGVRDAGVLRHGKLRALTSDEGDMTIYCIADDLDAEKLETFFSEAKALKASVGA